jgi:hypothetical protein
MMSLRAFHLFFIAVSIVLAAFCGAWAMGQYRLTHGAVFMVSAVGALGSALLLAAYGAAFQRKTKNL